MSLVAYEYSSDEEPEETQQNPAVSIKSNSISNHLASAGAATKESHAGEHPRNHLQLPAPKKMNDLNIEEEDDEFLRKKAVSETPLPAKPVVRNGKVQITIPSISDFKDDESVGGRTKKGKPVLGAELPKKSNNLLSVLPKPRAVLLGMPVSASAIPSGSSHSSSSGNTTFSKRLVPDSVANRPRSVPIGRVKSVSRTNVCNSDNPSVSQPASTAKLNEDSDENDEDGHDTEMVDFFSFYKDEALPMVSANEINAMVAKKAASIAETVRKYTEPDAKNDSVHSAGFDLTLSNAQQNHTVHPSDDLASDTALAALIGGNRAKRARTEQVDLIEITSADIVPSKEDFLRRQLQAETGYVATGHLVGDWTCSSKRKSHITQLANKAQANAQELEAMWAANRQSRRQTQSKYGF